MVLVRGDLLALAIILIVVGVFLIVGPLPYPVVYVGWVILVAGMFVLAYWVYRQARGS